MVVVYTITEINYFVVSLFCHMMWPISCLHLWYEVLWQHYLPCFLHSDPSCYDFPKMSFTIKTYQSRQLCWLHYTNISGSTNKKL